MQCLACKMSRYGLLEGRNGFSCRASAEWGTSLVAACAEKNHAHNVSLSNPPNRRCNSNVRGHLRHLQIPFPISDIADGPLKTLWVEQEAATHVQNIKAINECYMYASKHANRPLCPVPMLFWASRRAADPKHHAPTIDHHCWGDSSAARTLWHVLIRLPAGSRKPASCGSNPVILQATSPDVLWLPRGWRGVCGSHSAWSCHSQNSLRNATAQLPAKTWYPMPLTAQHFPGLSPPLSLKSHAAICMTLAVWHHDLRLNIKASLRERPYPPCHRACSAVSRSCDVSLPEVSAPPTSVSHTVFTTASDQFFCQHAMSLICWCVYLLTCFILNTYLLTSLLTHLLSCLLVIDLLTGCIVTYLLPCLVACLHACLPAD